VLQRWPQARLLIVGDGDDGPRLRQLADQLGLSGSALFAGFRSDLADLFARADLVLRTSINEGVNLTTIQALAAGLPVVGFANRVPREIIVDRGNGLLVAPRDAAQLAAAIQALAADAPLRQRLGEQGRADVRSAYDVRQVVAFYEQLYRMLAQRQSLAALPDQRRAARPVVQPLSLVPAHDD
jgi:glycosyltransferase involved in cell wall biosynthesis